MERSRCSRRRNAPFRASGKSGRPASGGEEGRIVSHASRTGRRHAVRSFQGLSKPAFLRRRRLSIEPDCMASLASNITTRCRINRPIDNVRGMLVQRFLYYGCWFSDPCAAMVVRHRTVSRASGASKNVDRQHSTFVIRETRYEPTCRHSGSSANRCHCSPSKVKKYG